MHENLTVALVLSPVMAQSCDLRFIVPFCQPICLRGVEAIVLRCFSPKNYICLRSTYARTACSCLSRSKRVSCKVQSDSVRVAPIFETDPVHFSLEYRSSMIITNWLPIVLFCNGPSKSMKIESDKLTAENRSRCRVDTYSNHLRVYSPQLVTVVYTSLAM